MGYRRVLLNGRGTIVGTGDGRWQSILVSYQDMLRKWRKLR